MLGVLEETGAGPRLAYVAGKAPVDQALLDAAGEVPPTRIMRFAARCAQSACTHFDGQDCQLAQRIVVGLAPVTHALPPCAVRRDCRWYAQEGVPACQRCPQITTQVDAPDARMLEIAGDVAAHNSG